MKPDGRDIKVKVLEMYHVCDGSAFEKDYPEKVLIGGRECISVQNCPHAEEKVYCRF